MNPLCCKWPHVGKKYIDFGVSVMNLHSDVFSYASVNPLCCKWPHVGKQYIDFGVSVMNFQSDLLVMLV